MNNDIKKLPIALWKYDRLCDRIDEMLDRHRGHRQIASLEPTLAPLTSRYREQYGGIDLHERQARFLVKVASSEVDVLASVMRSWVPTLSVHVGDFDMTPLVQAQVPDDVVIQGRRLVERLRYTQEGESAFPDAEDLIGELQLLTERADAALRAAQDALGELQRRRQALRGTAHELHRALVALRRVLRAVLGPKNRDYRLLRLTPIRRSEQGDDVDDPPDTPGADDAEAHDPDEGDAPPDTQGLDDAEAHDPEEGDAAA